MGILKKIGLARITLIAVIAAKSIKFLKLIKYLKFTKVLVTVLSMSLSALIYSFLLGPWFAIGLVLMLFIHEMGHIIALKIKGHETSGPLFIPMLGAVIFAPQFNDPEEEAFVGYGGPLVGGLAAIALFAVWKLMPNPPTILLSISYFAAFLNVFNLIPVRPLDGGRITRAVGGWFKYIGYAVLLYLLWTFQDPFFILILLMSLDDFNMNGWLRFWLSLACGIVALVMIWTMHIHWLSVIVITVLTWLLIMVAYTKARRWVPENPEMEAGANVPLPVRIKWLALYLALLGVLVAVMYMQFPYLPKR